MRKLRTLILSSRGNVESFREKLEKTLACEFLPNRVECSDETFASVKCAVLSPEAFSSDRITVYVHGGSFVGGSIEGYRGFCSSLAHALSSKLVLPDFRLAPSHPYPASAEDTGAVLNAFRAPPPREVLLCADGSGASIALSYVFSLPPAERSFISKIILFSPWLDLASDSFPKKHMKDEVLSSDDIFHAADLYTYSSNLKNVNISPLRAQAEDLASFPEVYIQMGGKELLLYQSVKFKEKLEAAGVRVTLDAVPGMMFMFQMADEYLEEPHLALERIGSYVNKKPDISLQEKLEMDRLIKQNHIITD